MKRLILAEFREILAQLDNEEITMSKAVWLINEYIQSDQSVEVNKKMSAEEILEETTRCTIDDDADIDNPENFYFKYNDVLQAMRDFSRQEVEAKLKELKGRIHSLDVETLSYIIIYDEIDNLLK
jgi:hypothetical protein